MHFYPDSLSRYVNSQLEPQLNEYRQLSQAMAQAKEQYKQVIATTENYCWSKNYAWDCFPLTNHRAPPPKKKRKKEKNCQWKEHDTNFPCQSDEKVTTDHIDSQNNQQASTTMCPTISQRWAAEWRRDPAYLPSSRTPSSRSSLRWRKEVSSWAELSSWSELSSEQILQEAEMFSVRGKWCFSSS